MNNKWCRAQAKEVIMYINQLMDEFPCRVFEVRNGWLYLVIDHYKHMDFKRHAKRVKLSKVKGNVQSGYYYLTHKI